MSSDTVKPLLNRKKSVLPPLNSYAIMTTGRKTRSRCTAGSEKVCINRYTINIDTADWRLDLISRIQR